MGMCGTSGGEWMKPLFKPRHVALALVGVGLSVAVYEMSIPLRESGLKSSCQTNLKQLGLATMQYARDYDEGWMIAPNWKPGLAPYLGGRIQRPQIARLFICPKTTDGYAYNLNLSASYLEAVSEPATLALFYEPASAINADNGKNWAMNGIHGDGSNVGFADGHVKWLRVKPAFWQASLNNKAKIAAKRAAWWRGFTEREKRRTEWIKKHAKKP